MPTRPWKPCAGRIRAISGSSAAGSSWPPALNAAAGGASFADFASCNAICGNPNSSDDDVNTCEAMPGQLQRTAGTTSTPFPEAMPTRSLQGGGAATACLIVDPTACAVQ
jgi:hypothetical protein